MTPLFRGTGTALSTPFADDGSIDFESFGRLIDFQLENRVEALIPCGSTGESATMTHDEKLETIRFTVERVRSHASNRNGDGHRTVVIAGTGSNVTADTITLSREAAGLGVDGVLLVGPYYNKPTQRGLVAHFSAIASALPELPIVLYNVPARTGSNFTAETTLELAHAHANIVAIKEASADLDQCSAILRDAPDGFLLYSGEDSLTLPLIAMGAGGVIAVVSNEVPGLYGDMVRAALAGDFSRARELHMKLFELMRLNFIETNPVPVKDALHQMGIFPSVNYRLPLVGLTDTNREKLRAGLEKLELLGENLGVRR
jgi:4-hydroxy-tetrahydrodipicolinate synthase